MIFIAQKAHLFCPHQETLHTSSVNSSEQEGHHRSSNLDEVLVVISKKLVHLF